MHTYASQSAGVYSSCLAAAAGGFDKELVAAGQSSVSGCSFSHSASSLGQALSLEPDLPCSFPFMSEAGRAPVSPWLYSPHIWQLPLCSPLPPRLHRCDQRRGWWGRDYAVPYSAGAR